MGQLLTMDRAILTTFTATYEECKDTLVNAIDVLTRNSHNTKLKNTSSWYSKEYCKLHPLVVYYLGPDSSLQHDSLCFSSDDNSYYTSFLYQVQTILVYSLKANHPHIIKN